MVGNFPSLSQQDNVTYTNHTTYIKTSKPGPVKLVNGSKAAKAIIDQRHYLKYLYLTPVAPSPPSLEAILSPRRKKRLYPFTRKKIVHGYSMDQPDWFVQLQTVDKYNPSLGHDCGGTRIETNIIITAAHCVMQDQEDNNFWGMASAKDVARVNVRLNCGKREQGGVIVQPEAIYVHAGWGFGNLLYEGELAIIRFNCENCPGKTMEMAKDLKQIPDDGMCRVYGYGKQWSFDVFWDHGPDTLQYADVKVLTWPDCDEAQKNFWEHMGLYGKFGPYWKNWTSGLCSTSGAGVATNKGDSGGPLISWREQKRPVLIGVISLGKFTFLGAHGWRTDEINSVYVSVAYFRPWIDHVAIPTLNEKKVRDRAAKCMVPWYFSCLSSPFLFKTE